MNTRPADPRTGHARKLALGSYALLVLVLSAEVFGILGLQPLTRAVVAVVWIGPLLVFLPGLLRGAWKSYLWLCFVTLIYFMMTVLELFDPQTDPGDWAELVLLVVLFNSAMLYARWRQRELAVNDC